MITELLLSLFIGAIIYMGISWLLKNQLEGKIEPLVDFNSQTRILSDGSRVCKFLKDDELITRMHKKTGTFYEMIRRGLRKSKDGPMLGVRNKNKVGASYEWISYSKVIDRSIDIAHAFRALKLPVGQKTFIGIYSKNRPEWLIVEHAIYTFNNVSVPLYETLGLDACIFIINQAELQLVVCDSINKANQLLEKHNDCPKLLYLIVMEDTISQNDVKNAEEKGIRLMTFAELEKLGHEQIRIELQPPKPDDLATICYTSGTTGIPKGVMLTHANMIADGTAMKYFKLIKLSPEDIMISFLPLAHTFERITQSLIFIEGGRVGFFSGNINTLIGDIQALHPTVMPVVPRLLNRIYDKVINEINTSKIKKLIFEIALKYKMYELNNGIIRNTSLVDQFVFKKIRESFGGRMKFMITGSAPIGENVLDFIRATLGCVVVEGYGQTEALEGDAVSGHVGIPIACNMIKLVDVPDLGYFSTDNSGEICVRGANVFKGYYKNEEETRNVFDNDGWLYTGDIGCWTERGTLKIIDRKKHIFKLSQGEYIAPEKIENIYVRSKFVAQIFVYGDSLYSYLVGIVVPDSDVLIKEAINIGLHGLTFKELCECEDIKMLILEDLIKIGKAAKLNGFEKLKKIHLSAKQFSVENNLLTPTFKSKRPQLKQYFGDVIDKMYSDSE